MNDESQEITIKTMSEGLLDDDFKFQCSYYSYVEKRMITPAEEKYAIILHEERGCNATCVVSSENNALSVTIDNLNLEKGSFPFSFSSRCQPHHYNLIGKDGADFRMLMFTFADMKTNLNENYRCEFILDKGELTNIGFIITSMDNNFHVLEKELNLVGSIVL